MKYTSPRISDEIKAEIMEAASIPGCIVSSVAKNYNISPKLLYSWRSKARKSNQSNQQENLSKAALVNEVNFIELSMNKSSNQKPNLTKQSTNLFLQKVSLEFNNVTFELQGNISGKKLIQLISILEQPC